ncbi:MAG: MBL fold metallo-hydrolase [Chloroflexota bacterium]|nr:MBL fold metallo-hydrolase [Chloroflexota bacterium]
MALEPVMANLSVTTLCDDHPYDPSLKVSSGFSCLIQIGGEAVLFDAGLHGFTLLHNMERLGHDPRGLQAIVLSHIDADHAQGIWEVLKAAGPKEVYVPASVPAAFQESLTAKGGRVMLVSGPRPIKNGLVSTGEMGPWIKEQALMARTEQGPVLVVGCGHPGIMNMVARAGDIAGEPVRTLIGGFDLSTDMEAEIERVVAGFRDLGVRRVAPCHCTGQPVIERLRQEYGPDFIANGVGRVMELGSVLPHPLPLPVKPG